jgi:hypothetical protein
MLAKYNDEYHKLVREKQKEYYYKNGGKTKAQVRKYLERYGLDSDFVNDCTTDELKVEKLKKYANEMRALKHQKKIAEMTASQAVVP